MVPMEDDKVVTTGENVENPEIVECRICGYHYQKTKKCPNVQ
jgi:Zn ribbon nucleic-acid-binding protein